MFKISTLFKGKFLENPLHLTGKSRNYLQE